MNNTLGLGNPDVIKKIMGMFVISILNNLFSTLSVPFLPCSLNINCVQTSLKLYIPRYWTR